MIKITNTVTRFATAVAAEAMIAANLAAVPEGGDLTFAVMASGERFVVAIYDEEGFEIGTL